MTKINIINEIFKNSVVGWLSYLAFAHAAIFCHELAYGQYTCPVVVDPLVIEPLVIEPLVVEDVVITLVDPIVSTNDSQSFVIDAVHANMTNDTAQINMTDDTAQINMTDDTAQINMTNDTTVYNMPLEMTTDIIVYNATFKMIDDTIVSDTTLKMTNYAVVDNSFLEEDIEYTDAQSGEIIFYLSVAITLLLFIEL